MKEHYFVVMGYVNDDGKIIFRQDLDSIDARFSDGSVWDTTTEEWSRDESDIYSVLNELIAGSAKGVTTL